MRVSVSRSSATALPVPPALHDVLGERTRRLDLVLILLASAVVATLFVLRTDTAGLAWWRVALAVALVADIAAGAIANLTEGTNDYYVERPAHRWGFIAMHVHILVLAWALNIPMAQAVALWGFTIVSATGVNLLLGHPSQSSVAGLLVTLGATGTLMWQPSAPPAVVLVYLLFLFKVVFSFAVDHHAARADRSRTGVRALSSRDREAFVELIVAAFEDDPLFVRLFPSADRKGMADRRAFASFVLDLNLVFGGAPQGLFVDGCLVAAWLLEPPLSRRRRAVALSLAIVRGLPLLFRLGLSRMQWLNTCSERTRAAMPDGPHHYLVMLGVRPDCQGHGYGREALTSIAKEVEANEFSHGVGLDTENPDNVPLYQRFGYEALGPEPLGGDVVAHCMVRRTQGGGMTKSRSEIASMA